MKEILQKILDIKGDYSNIEAKEFEKFICSFLEKHGKVSRQVKVPDRGDGRSGRIDIVFEYRDELIPIEIDRKTPRIKSVYKVRSFNSTNAFILVRSPFDILQV